METAFLNNFTRFKDAYAAVLIVNGAWGTVVLSLIAFACTYLILKKAVAIAFKAHAAL